MAESVLKSCEAMLKSCEAVIHDCKENVIQPCIDCIVPYWDVVRSYVNANTQHLEPWQIIFITASSTLVIVWLLQFLFQPEQSLWERVKKSTFSVLRNLPFIHGKIQEELDKQMRVLEDSIHKTAQGHSYQEHLPATGLTETEVLKQLAHYRTLVKVKWSEGACSGAVYSGEEKLSQLMAKIYGDFAWSNPLHADIFPDVRKMEAEVVRMTLNMFRGNSETCGTMTSGGTESILLACKAYRDLAYSCGIRHPEMVIPETAHAAFDKAGGYFRIKVIHIPVDATSRKVNLRAMKRAISSQTCMLVGSAPQFGHGVLDPITEIAKLGLRYNVPVHVDSCLGGFLVPFMRKAGFDIEPFDFTVNGVTSISADTHKYGFAPKGSSVIMYRNKTYRRHQYFVATDWPGGIYVSPTIAGSRAGAIIAACWATMMYIGEDGYVDSTRKIITTTRYLAAKIENVKGIFLYAKPEVSVVAVGSKDFNIYRLSDAMHSKGWNLNALQYPPSIHLCVTLVHTRPGIIDRFIADFIECVAAIMKEPNAKASGQAAMYGMAQSIPDRSIVSEIAGSFFDAYYSTGEPGSAKEPGSAAS